MSVNESRNGARSDEGAPAFGAPSPSRAAASAPAAPPESARISEVTCIRCPLGCAITVDVAPDGAAVYREGASCARGREYAVAEVTAPVRSVATTINVPGCGEPLSVKTADPIPKPLIADTVRAMKAAHVELPVRMGDMVLPDVCGTGVPVVATKSLP